MTEIYINIKIKTELIYVKLKLYTIYIHMNNMQEEEKRFQLNKIVGKN